MLDNFSENVGHFRETDMRHFLQKLSKGENPLFNFIPSLNKMFLHNRNVRIHSWDKLFGLCGSKRAVWITSNVMLPRQFQLKVNTHVHLEERKISSFFFAVLSQENHFSLQFPIPRKKLLLYFFTRIQKRACSQAF